MLLDPSSRLLMSLASAELGRETCKIVFFIKRLLETSSYQSVLHKMAPSKGGRISQSTSPKFKAGRNVKNNDFQNYLNIFFK